MLEIEDEELRRFHAWLQAKGDQPSVVLTLRWIAEFEVYAEEDEEAFLDLKAWLRSRNDPEAASVLRFVIEFEETVEPDPRLKRFHDWLRRKAMIQPQSWHGGGLMSSKRQKKRIPFQRG